MAALLAAEALDLPVLGWTLPLDVAQKLAAEYGVPFSGHPADGIDLVLPVERRRSWRP